MNSSCCPLCFNADCVPFRRLVVDTTDDDDVDDGITRRALRRCKLLGRVVTMLVVLPVPPDDEDGA